MKGSGEKENGGSRYDDTISKRAVMDFVGSMEMCDRITADAYKELICYLEDLPPAQPTLLGYNIEHLELIASVLQKENLPPERVAEVLTDIGRIVAMVKDEVEEELRKALNNFPPAQPEHATCYLDSPCEYQDINIALPSAQPEQRWIPVTERLPEKPNMYTVTDSKGDVVRFVYTGTKSSRKYWLRCAIAWMPQQEPYKGEQK